MILVLATGKVRLSLPRACLIAALTYLALGHVRHAMLFGIAAPLLAAPALGAAWPPKAETGSGRAVAALAILSVLLLGTRLLLPATRGEDRVSPMTALAHVPGAVRATPVLNAYDYGGYLIALGVRVFIDGRTDMYPTDFLRNDDRLLAGDVAALRATLARYRIGWTIYPANSGAARTLDHLSGWHRLYGDANAVVHVRDQPPPPG
jgi:hypothetical protein